MVLNVKRVPGEKTSGCFTGVWSGSLILSTAYPGGLLNFAPLEALLGYALWRFMVLCVELAENQPV